MQFGDQLHIHLHGHVASLLFAAELTGDEPLHGGQRPTAVADHGGYQPTHPARRP
jgi:hypothetical protein